MILIHGESGYRKNFTQRTFLWYNKYELCSLWVF